MNPSWICRRALILVLALFLTPAERFARAQPSFWQSLNGPEGGVIQCFARQNNGDILAGTYFGGVYRTSNSGAQWERLTYMNLDIRSLLVLPNDEFFLGAASSGMWKSTDGGATWGRPTNILNGRTVTALVPAASGALIAGCASTSSQAVYRSTDGGQTFALVSSGVLSANSICRDSSGTLYVAGNRNGVIVSTDGGLLWSITNPSPAQFDGLGICATPGEVIVVGRRTAATIPDSSFIYRRPLATGIWELVRIQSGVVLRTVTCSGDSLLAAGGTTVLVSTDGGQTWEERGTASYGEGKPLHPVLTAVTFPGIQMLGTSGRSAAVSTDFAQSWSQASRGLQNTHIVAGTLLPPGRLIVSAQFDGLFALESGSISRTGDGLPESDVVTALANDGVAVYAGTANNGLYRSADGGATFSQCLYGPTASGILSITTDVPGVVRAGGKGEYIHTSVTYGATWGSVRLPPSLTTNVTGIQGVSQNEYFVSTGEFGGTGAGNGVYHTSNGTDFTQYGLAFTAVVSFSRAAENRLLASTTLSQVYERYNTPSWTLTPSLDVGIKARVAGLYQYGAEPYREYLGTSAGFFDREAFTANAWVARPLPGPLEVAWIGNREDAAPPRTVGTLVAGTYGGGVFESTGPLTAVAETEAAPSDFALGQNYPNPFNPVARIEFHIAERSHVDLAVYDLLGRTVARLVDDVRAAGTHTVTFDATGLASGVYLYRMTAGGFAASRKMVVIK